MNQPHNQEPSLAELLRSARLSAGLSIREVARRSGLSYPYLSRLENGEKKAPSADTLQRLAEVLRLEPSELLAYIGIQEASTLPAPRAYFRSKLGVNAEEADVLARLIEEYQEKREKRKEGHNEEGD